VSSEIQETAGKCFLCSRTIWPEDATTTAAGLPVHRACYDKFVRPGLLPDAPKPPRRDDK
jgi:hypothetical protein